MIRSCSISRVVRRSTVGFSKLELLAVIAILVTLLSISVQAYLAMQRQAERRMRVERRIGWLIDQFVGAHLAAKRGREVQVSISLDGLQHHNAPASVTFQPPDGRCDIPTPLVFSVGNEHWWYEITLTPRGQCTWKRIPPQPSATNGNQFTEASGTGRP